MQVVTIANGSVSLLLIPEDDSEIELLKKLGKQQNDITELRQQVMVLNKTFTEGLLIGKAPTQKEKDDPKEKTM